MLLFRSNGAYDKEGKEGTPYLNIILLFAREMIPFKLQWCAVIRLSECLLIKLIVCSQNTFYAYQIIYER